MPKINANLLSELRIDSQHRDHEEARPARWLWPLLAVVVVLAVAAAGAWWWFLGRPLEVTTATALSPATAATAGAVLQATGYITARRQATVATQITGTLTQVLIEEGDRVEKGQIIARLEDNGLRAGLNVAQANVQSAQAQMATTQAQLTQAVADVARQEALVKDGMVTKQAAEQSRTAVLTARAQLDARQREIDAALAQVTQAKVNFDYAVIRAPFSGVVTVKAAQVGEIVSPLSAGGGFTRTGVGTIVDMDSLELDVDVSEAYIGQVRRDMAAEAVLSAYPDWKIPAHVLAIVPSADRGKATIKVRVALDQKDSRIVPDMGARVSFLGQKPAPAAAAPKGTLVPPQAIAQRDGRSVVFVVDGAHAVQRSVTPVAQDVNDLKLLPEGVAVGERVVLSPPVTLKDGAAIQIAASK